MELADLVTEIHREARVKVPDVFNKVVSAANTEGLIDNNNVNALKESHSSVKSGMSAAIKKPLIACASTLLAAAVATTAIVVPIVLTADSGDNTGGGNCTSTEAPNGNGGSTETPTTPTTPENPETPVKPEQPENPLPPHEHNYKVIFDDDNHWNKCSSCGDVADETSHDFNGDGVCNDCGYKTGFEYTLYYNKYSISIGSVTDKNIVIPTVYNGLPVTEIACRGFENLSFLESVVIPDGIKTIENSAFYGCTALKSVSIPNSVTMISFNAFMDCTSLESIVVPDSVTTMNEGTFWGCTSLVSATIGKNVPSIGNSTFDSCTNLKEIIIKNPDIRILNSIVAKCPNLTKITFEGTKAQWSDVLERSKDDFDGSPLYWGNQSGNFKIYCSDGTVSK